MSKSLSNGLESFFKKMSCGLEDSMWGFFISIALVGAIFVLVTAWFNPYKTDVPTIEATPIGYVTLAGRDYYLGTVCLNHIEYYIHGAYERFHLTPKMCTGISACVCQPKKSK